MTLEQQIKEVVRLKDKEGYSFKTIGKTMGFSESTAKRRFSAHKGLKALYNNIYIKEESPFDFKRFTPLERTGDVLISCDWHIPLHDPKMVNNLLRVGQEQNIKSLIIDGDFFNLDTFSHFVPHQPEANLEVERAYALEIMDALLEVFDEVDFIWGNHDFRIVRFLNFELSFEYCMRWLLAGLGEEKLSRIRISDLDNMFYKTDERTFRVCHPKNYSKIPLAVPRQLAHKYGTSIITGHSHHCAMGVALDGFNLLIDAGGLFDPNKTQYIQKTDFNHNWVQGFVTFVDNVPKLYSPQFGNL